MATEAGNSQKVATLRNGMLEVLDLPAPDAEVLPGVPWGHFDQFFTPAFWRARLWIDGEHSDFANYKLGKNLREEVAACLLGGFGMPAEVGLVAFQRLMAKGLLDGTASASSIERALRRPLNIRGRQIRYRYPKTKSRFVAHAMRRLNSEIAPTDCPRSLRNWLMSYDGIGPKTASWITRNIMESDQVAVLDVHILRAGTLMGLFKSTDDVSRDYFQLEDRLVSFARALGVKLAEFDSVLWCYMRQLNSLALSGVRSQLRSCSFGNK